MNLRHATKQEVFDHVVRHLVNQGEPARTFHGICQYRTAHGLSCAVGCLIEPEHYKAGMEGIPVADLVTRFPHLGIRPDHVTLLDDLQKAHDDWSMFPQDIWRFRDALCRVARRHFVSQMAVFTTIRATTEGQELEYAS